MEYVVGDHDSTCICIGVNISSAVLIVANAKGVDAKGELDDAEGELEADVGAIRLGL